MKIITTEDLSTIKFKKARKKPVIIKCKQIKEDFMVDSLEGRVKGKKGDWLMVGVRGELYICDKDIFEETY
ncbi:MAG: hypothetical protein R3213_10510, partial [Flavobacteriaceae bacterium]|nr:hypothetical protein [Flavobacteriaceae bacterium]